MQRRVIVGGVVVVVVAVLAWKLLHRGGDDAAARAPERGSAAHTLRGPRAPAAPGSLSGHVTRKADGSPLAGATVAVTAAAMGPSSSGGDEPPAIVSTDAHGAWTLPGVSPGAYLVTAAAPGFVPALHARFEVAAGEQRGGIDLALEPGGTPVRGTISDIGGGAISGAQVMAVGHDPAAIASRNVAPFVVASGADGKFELDLPAGGFELTVHHDDYTDATREIEVANKPLVEDFTLVPGGTIHGQVVARDSKKPIAGAHVTAHSNHDPFNRTGRKATTDGDGKFTMKSVHSGAISLEASAPGYASSAPSLVEVGIGEQVDGVRLVLDHAPSISGRVVERGQQTGVAGVHLSAWSMGSQQQLESTEPTGPDGAFEIAGVKPGSYMLFAFGENQMPELNKNVEVADKDVTGVIVEMSAGATLSGRVDPGGPARIGIALAGEVGLGNLFDVMKTMFVHADTDATGSFVLHHVPAGSFSLVATTREGASGKLPVTVTAGDQNGLVVQLETRASISGRVIDTKGAAVAGLKVNALPMERKAVTFELSGAGNKAVSADDGTFKIVGLDAGKYTVRAWDLFGMGEQPSEKRKPEDVIELAAGVERTGVTVTVPARDGVIRGQVLGSDHKPAPDSWITVRRDVNVHMRDRYGDFAGLDAAPPVLTKEDGKFVVDKLKPGTYTVVAEGPRGASHGEKPGVKPGDNVTIELASLGTLSGHVAQGGTPVASYDIDCGGPAGPIERHVDASDGAYALEHLAPGHYACDVSGDSGTAAGQVDVPAGAATLDLTVVPWASIVGSVVSVLTGQPVPNVAAFVNGNGDRRQVMALITGGGPATDASGRFTIDHVGAGSGAVMLMAKSSMEGPLATKPYTVQAGQRLDLGVIKVVPPRQGDAGTLGMATEIQGDSLAVTLVQPGGPAAQAGIVVGDKIISIDGHSVAELTPATAQKVISSGTIGAGEQAGLGLERGQTVTVTAAKW